jgi:hypothetical protein
MRSMTEIIAALALAMALVQAFGDSGQAASNCGFLTIEQCRATVSGIGGFCVPNQFYNPQRAGKDARNRRGAQAYQLPYDPYPWCADYSDGAR